jgi:hypothetical protein
LDVYNLATNDGARIAQWTRNDGAWQQWQFLDSGSSYYRLRSRHSGKVVDVYNASTADGADIVQWSDHNGANQQFQLVDSDSGYVRVVNRNSGKALDVYNASTADGADIVQWSDHNGANQQWQLVRVGSTTTTTTTTTTSAPAGNRPCDIYAAGGTPCVAAHSTTRALYDSYNGALYQVRRSSDNTTRDIGVLSAGGVADAAAQDSFCANTTCLITIIYDQSGRNNRLTQALGGGVPGPGPGGSDNLADAKAAPITIGDQKAYGVYVAPGTGYRNNNTNGVATGDQPEGMYAVLNGTHYNGGCCFDYGNAQTNAQADDTGIMEAIYFGNNNWWGYGDGNGPWIMADMEWGLFSGVNPKYNPMPSVNHRFLTAVVKGEPNHWAIRGGNAQSGGLTTYFDGQRPNGYHPMKKEGAILLGIGGDNSNGGAGTFYEGVMTTGYPTDVTENAVQANIASAGYR